MNLVVNLVAFKVGWVASVVGSANGLPLAGPAIVLIALMVHFYLCSEPSREFALVLLTALIGFCADSVLVSAGWLTFANGTFVVGLAPYWILGMWMLFATTLNVAFRWLHDKLLLAAVLGAISGPASYYAGSKIGAVVLTEMVPALAALSIGWAIILPLLMLLARQFDGTQVPALEGRA